MAKAWINTVQRSGQLTVFAGPGFTGGMWATVLKDAIVAFNDLMTAKGVKLKLVPTTQKPSESGVPISILRLSPQRPPSLMEGPSIQRPLTAMGYMVPRSPWRLSNPANQAGSKRLSCLSRKHPAKPRRHVRSARKSGSSSSSTSSCTPPGFPMMTTP